MVYTRGPYVVLLSHRSLLNPWKIAQMILIVLRMSLVMMAGPGTTWSRTFERCDYISHDHDFDLPPGLEQNEKFVPPADHHNTTGEFISSVHSFNGINSVSLSGWGYSSDEIMVKATKELPEFPFNEDMNSGYHLGYGESLRPVGAPSSGISVTSLPGWTQWTIGNGARSSSAVSYLGPEYIKRPNLAVLLHARVLRLGQTKSSSNNIAFREVQFTQDAGGTDCE
jgi:hypothetical protein